MGKRLDLDANWIDDDTLRVSWNDVKANDQNKSFPWILGLIWFPLFLISMFTAISGGGGLFFGIMFIALIGMVIWYQGTTTVPNHVDFTSEQITVDGRNYATTDITRFDYGVKSQLTGIMPAKNSHGQPASDPTMIRMWVNDSAPVTISENNWAFDVCHQIRDALDQALPKVRANEKDTVKDAKFGKTGDFGVPDY